MEEFETEGTAESEWMCDAEKPAAKGIVKNGEGRNKGGMHTHRCGEE